MHTDPLVKMANQIAAFFDAMPDRAEALEGVALHIRKFWVPRMRQRFLPMWTAAARGCTRWCCRRCRRTGRFLNKRPRLFLRFCFCSCQRFVHKAWMAFWH